MPKHDPKIGGWRPRLDTPKCASCTPSLRCRECVNRRRREVYEAKNGGPRRGPKVPPKWKGGHKRCDDCRTSLSQCKSCYNIQRAATLKMRLENDPEFAARERAMDRERSRRYREGRRDGAPAVTNEARRTRPRCETCPPVGPPCQPCAYAHKQALRKAKRASEGCAIRQAVGHKKARAPRPTLTPEQKAERERIKAEATAARKASEATLKAAREAQQAAAQSAARSTLMAELTRETRLSVCQVCQTRGRWEGNFCRRHQEAAVVPAGWGTTQKSRAYTAG